MLLDDPCSPPAFTSPLFNQEQPVPMPSDWTIIKMRKKPQLGLSLDDDSDCEQYSSGKRLRLNESYEEINEILDRSSYFTSSSSSVRHSADVIPAVTSSGTRLSFPKHPVCPVLSTNQPWMSGRLLSQPIHRLMDQVDAMLAAKPFIDPLVDNDCLSQSTGKTSARLWVDKYSPKMFVDLVGDAKLNRDILTWVKHWDYCVFKKPIKKQHEHSLSRFNKVRAFIFCLALSHSVP